MAPEGVKTNCFKFRYLAIFLANKSSLHSGGFRGVRGVKTGEKGEKKRKEEKKETGDCCNVFICSKYWHIFFTNLGGRVRKISFLTNIYVYKEQRASESPATGQGRSHPNVL